jgi:dihydrofolate synthase / folylpolyglutamate synthase
VLAPHFDHAFLTRYTDNPRSVPPEQLAGLLRDNGALPATVCPTPGEAYRAALAATDEKDILCITGSVFLAGELRPLLVSAASPAS